MKYHLTRRSANLKTGPIPVSTSARATCPTACALATVCYAAQGKLGLHWRKVSEGHRGTDWHSFLRQVRELPKGLWRHNQAGDLPHRNGRISAHHLSGLVRANLDGPQLGFTYTHHRPDIGHNAHLIQGANVAGFTVNLSANGLEDADTLADYNVGPVVTIAPEHERRTTYQTPAGRTVTTCPAVLHERITCASCQLCAKPHRRAIVAFPVHGPRRKQWSP